jgi:hypothetical protein
LRRKAPVENPPTGPRGGGGFDETFGEKAKASRSQSKDGAPRRWGSPNGKATLGLEKHVDVEVTSDEVVIGNDVIVPLGRGETRKELTALLLSGLEGHIQTWGAPPPDFYWVPTVRFIVKPGGSAHCARLEGILREAGIRSVINQVRATRQTAPKAR